jgi:hypothetical protein
MRNVDKFFNGAGVSGNGNIDRRIYAGDFDSAFAEISYGCGGAVFMKRTAFFIKFYLGWSSSC